LKTVPRNGVDQDAIVALLCDNGFVTELITYWSQQSAVFQAMGEWLQLENCFAVHARRSAA
jgi:hypothetical protein